MEIIPSAPPKPKYVSQKMNPSPIENNSRRRITGPLMPPPMQCRMKNRSPLETMQNNAFVRSQSKKKRPHLARTNTDVIQMLSKWWYQTEEKQ